MQVLVTTTDVAAALSAYLYKKNCMRLPRLQLPFLLFLLPALASCQAPPSLEQMVGQMILIGLPANTVDTGSTFYKDIRAGKVGGITLYERHLTPTNATQNLRALIATYQAVAPLPLFVAITQEGGQVNRLKPKYGFPPMPSAQYLGSLNNLDSTKYYSDLMATTLAQLGINVNFAPVVDVLMPTNPVLGSRQRTYSASTGVITRQAEQVVRSHNHYKVHTVLKHFPGHGSSTEDSHLGVTDVSKTWKPEELAPYRDLIKKGLVESIMTAHIVNARLDQSKLPATLSKKVITDLLRKDLGFEGVIFSDDMHMKAISAEYGLKESIELAISAGVDVLLFSGNLNGTESTSAGELVAIILELVKEKKISEQRIRASYARILKMKQRWNSHSGTAINEKRRESADVKPKCIPSNDMSHV
jgi:beta-N-acetylhexosaminidase